MSLTDKSTSCSAAERLVPPNYLFTFSVSLLMALVTEVLPAVLLHLSQPQYDKLLKTRHALMPEQRTHRKMTGQIL